MIRSTLAATALVLASATAATAPAAAADSIGCTAEYKITNTWPSSTRDGVTLGQVTVRNSGSSAIHGWRVTWRYTDGSSVLDVWGAVPLPVVGPVGTYAYGNEKYNGDLAPNGATVFGFAARIPLSPVAISPSPVTCTPVA
ncbi:cellulose binding domain-containing protein [Microbispora sp. RL4-1S]|uniref:Cellulose binding domain-containing protein n=1 Tax=Microbispora oryzae TaxID=2806554 RepID=A0A940WML0_9ACTN|nr:cellulose binding domain-containing protein [Microbispora oryzae]MBP2705783.1 cellulose binding domain-containing protein [Microbispora oryzae]